MYVLLFFFIELLSVLSADWHCIKLVDQCILCTEVLGGQHSAAVKRPLRNDKDVGSNPAAAERKTDIGDPPTEGSSMVWTGSKWKTGDVKAELDL